MTIAGSSIVVAELVTYLKSNFLLKCLRRVEVGIIWTSEGPLTCVIDA